MRVIDPVKFVALCWPDITLYDKQREVLYSVRDNDETFVPAGNALGKDFVAGLCALWFFVSRRPARVITTSVKQDQLDDVLWAEIRRFIDTSEVSLPIQYNHLHIRQVRKDGSLEPRSSLLGQVTRQGESLLGRHLERGENGEPTTLAIFDEASGIDDMAYESSDTWAHRKLVIGNPYPCSNFFFKGVKEGDREAKTNGHLYRHVIRIKAEDSPNVRLAQSEIAGGGFPTGEILVPGVIDYATYIKRREVWDEVRQCVGLDAEFYEGAEALLYPPDWLNRAETIGRELEGKPRIAKTIGIDPAQGGDSTVWAVVDHEGLIELVSRKTPDTSVITGDTLALMKQHDVEAGNVLFDAGGGGKEHADRLRRQGHPVRTVAFGETASPPLVKRMKTVNERVTEKEDRYIYKNRRAEMYGLLRAKLNPVNEPGFGLPEKYPELRRQLSPIPLMYDGEGRLELPPKNKRDPRSRKVTMTDLIGCSPDEADALVLAVFGLVVKAKQQIAGAVK